MHVIIMTTATRKGKIFTLLSQHWVPCPISAPHQLFLQFWWSTNYLLA